MLISNFFNNNKFDLIMDGTILKIVETLKHLGVHLSSNNKLSKNIDSIIESVSKQISFLRKIFNYFSFQNKLSILSTALKYDHFLNMLVKYGTVALKQTQID